MMRFNFKNAMVCLCLAGGMYTSQLLAQAPAKPSAAKILHDMRKLNVLGNVLYMAAHPDDENTTFIAYMANERQFNTSYLSLTRGDGGQNLIGPEIREQLGMIRTQELLQARRMDGGKQYFSRANDFGFSKNPEEVFTIWEREKLLADAVWVIRNVKPDVIVTRFPPDSRAGHGHHSASSILAEEAFDAAADPKRFPEQLKYVEPWQAKRLMWNISMWGIRNKEEFIKNVKNYLQLDVGGYNALLGKSYGEISAESRSMHKSQGFGSIGTRGVSVEYLQHTKGTKAQKELFEDINTTWTRVKGSEKIQQLVTALLAGYKPADPSASVPMLLKIKTELTKLPDGFWKTTKLKEVNELIKNSLGLYLEATAADFAFTPGETVQVSVEAVNRSSANVVLQKVVFPFESGDTTLSALLKNNNDLDFVFKTKIPAEMPISQPYWLRKPIGYKGLFSVEDQEEIGRGENPPVAMVALEVLIEGQKLHYETPVVFKKKDPVAGEVYQPLVVTPPVFANIAQDVYMFEDQQAKKVLVAIKAGKDECVGEVRLDLPSAWKSVPERAPFALKLKGEEQMVEFALYPPAESQETEITAVVEVEGKSYDHSFGMISYGHIPTQVFFPKATARAIKLDLIKKGSNIGYLMGAGDLIPVSLRQIGYQVTVLEDKDITPEKLSQFDAIVAGVRVYNTNKRMKHYQAALMDYVKNGGNFIIQYNTDMDLVMKDIGPYPFTLTRDRITVEGSEVRFLKPESPVLNVPNKITPADFKDWVQERGLYFPQKWSPEYEAVISSNDPDNPALDGGILVAKYGKGNYVYTSLSWFRELPAGVPGAYRVFVNLLSLGK
ncbi:Mycothiol S-conjugate amidase [Dyadobacter sp. CECT 9275]|uniref:Mycothiol S-conjugate amidase n=1 Tax=Dyadobacter helix TaxID=2822344 RepID=A0A916J9L6_9BACT|nr:PIG-L family deacetylase [Dyadobacter sp. CECT 9275]CAG4992448.1 Mycothiol S-conjugate amidase [Dyadobacter sp. CECT 9275]